MFIGFKALNDIELKERYKYVLYFVLIFASFYIGYEQLIYHPPGEGFDKSEDYNELLKMDNDTAKSPSLPKQEDEDSLEKDLFNLIDSMYENKEEK